MNLREFQECVEFNIEHGIKHAVLGLGAPGVGKSQIVQQIGKKFGYKVIDIRLAQMSEVEIGGLIYPNEERTKTKWLSPEILPDEERDGKNTILLLDEITSCPKRVQVAAYQLILDRKVGQYRLPEGTFVIALGNREDDDGVYIQLAGPLADRFEIHYIDVDFASWKYDFALKHDVHPMVVNYLTFKPSALHNQKEEEESMVFSTPRSWERVSDILKIDNDITKNVVRNKIIGNIGLTEGTQFIEFCKNNVNGVSAEDFIANKAKAPKEPEKLAILVAALTDPLLYLQKYHSASELTQEQRKQVEATIKALFRLNSSEFTIVGLRNLLEMNRVVVKEIFALVDDLSIDTFIAKNRYAIGLN